MAGDSNATTTNLGSRLSSSSQSQPIPITSLASIPSSTPNLPSPSPTPNSQGLANPDPTGPAKGPLVCVIDGGGSATRVCIMDEEGNIRGKGSDRSSNYSARGITEAIQSIGRAVETAVNRAGGILTPQDKFWKVSWPMEASERGGKYPHREGLLNVPNGHGGGGAGGHNNDDDEVDLTSSTSSLDLSEDGPSISSSSTSGCPFVQIWAGLAGVDSTRDEQVMHSALSTLFGLTTSLEKKRLKVSNDCFLLASATGHSDRWGVVLIAGTGSIAMAFERKFEGSFEGVTVVDGEDGVEGMDMHSAVEGDLISLGRRGGYGYLLGDEGSAYWVGREAITAVLEIGDWLAGHSYRTESSARHSPRDSPPRGTSPNPNSSNDNFPSNNAHHHPTTPTTATTPSSPPPPTPSQIPVGKFPHLERRSNLIPLILEHFGVSSISELLGAVYAMTDKHGQARTEHDRKVGIAEVARFVVACAFPSAGGGGEARVGGSQSPTMGDKIPRLGNSTSLQPPIGNGFPTSMGGGGVEEDGRESSSDGGDALSLRILKSSSVRLSELVRDLCRAHGIQGRDSTLIMGTGMWSSEGFRHMVVEEMKRGWLGEDGWGGVTMVCEPEVNGSRELLRRWRVATSKR